MSEVVLYVDDEPANLLVFEAAFEHEFEVLTTSDPAEALRILGDREIAVLITDQRMPKMTGVELLTAARQRHPEVVRLLMTAYSDMNAAMKAVNEGHVRRYLRKPWQPDELQAALSDAVDSYRTTRRLQELERRLVETERVYALGVVAASVAHELRNPLTGLVGMLELAAMSSDKLRGEMSPGLARDEELSGALFRAAHFISEARVSAGTLVDIANAIALPNRRSDDQSSADWAEVVRLTLKSVQRELQKRARLDIDLAPTERVRGTPTQLGQVTLNLLVNALQAIPFPTPQEHHVTLRLRPEGTMACLDVEDTGPGISKQVMAKIFDPFFTTKPDGGTGLGLAISRRIVEELGGRIDVESIEGKGTIFKVRIPLAPKS